MKKIKLSNKGRQSLERVLGALKEGKLGAFKLDIGESSDLEQCVYTGDDDNWPYPPKHCAVGCLLGPVQLKTIIARGFNEHGVNYLYETYPGNASMTKTLGLNADQAVWLQVLHDTGFRRMDFEAYVEAGIREVLDGTTIEPAFLNPTKGN